MNEGKELIKKMQENQKSPWFSANNIAAYTGKPMSVNENGECSLNGNYTIAEIEAILICAYNERATTRF